MATRKVEENKEELTLEALAEKVTTAENKISALTKQNQTLEAKLQAFESMEEKVTTAESNISDLTKKNQTLEQKLQAFEAMEETRASVTVEEPAKAKKPLNAEFEVDGITYASNFPKVSLPGKEVVFAELTDEELVQLQADYPNLFKIV